MPNNQRAAQQASADIQSWYLTFFSFVASKRTFVQLLAVLAVALLSFELPRVWKIVLVAVAVLAEALFVLSDRAIGKIRDDERNRHAIANKLFAACLRDICQAVEYIKAGAHADAMRSLESVQTAILTLIADEAQYAINAQKGDVASNIMLPDFTGDVPKLDLVRFSQMHIGREPLSLIVDKGNPSPGAVKALLTGQTTYVDDTHKYEQFDHGKPYRSIVCYPLLRDGVRDTVGVVNVDSNAPFSFEEDVREALEPTILPWLQALTVTVSLFQHAYKLVTPGRGQG